MQADPGVGAQGYSYFAPGSTVTFTWTIRLVHLPEHSDTGVSFFWKDNTLRGDCFINHRFNYPLQTSGTLGNHTFNVTIPNMRLTNATIMWYWNATDLGYYHSCIDFSTVRPGALSTEHSESEATGSLMDKNNGHTFGPMLALGVFVPALL